MLITSVDTFLVPPRWLFLKITTDESIRGEPIVGWGEATLEGFADVTRTAVHVLAEQLLGKDPLPIEDHWQHLTKAGFYRGGPVLSSAVAGIDQALWDVAGKAYGLPVHQLLGGPVRERMRVYGWIGGDDPEEVAEGARKQVEAGLTAVKMNASGALPAAPTSFDLQAVVDRATAVREAIGPELDFAIDFHGRISAVGARRLIALLEPLRPLFIEEPVAPGNEYANLERIVAGSITPIATGERLYSRWQFLPVLQAGVRIVQPDLSHAGGISEVRRIAALAETFDAAVAPHCPLGPLALAASLQVDFATPNALIQEQSLGIHYHHGSPELLAYLADTHVFDFISGYVERPTGAGLGVIIDEDAVRRGDAEGHAWRTPKWRHPDGSLAEW